MNVFAPLTSDVARLDFANWQNAGHATIAHAVENGIISAPKDIVAFGSWAFAKHGLDTLMLKVHGDKLRDVDAFMREDPEAVLNGPFHARSYQPAARPVEPWEKYRALPLPPLSLTAGRATAMIVRNCFRPSTYDTLMQNLETIDGVAVVAAPVLARSKALSRRSSDQLGLVKAGFIAAETSHPVANNPLWQWSVGYAALELARRRWILPSHDWMAKLIELDFAPLRLPDIESATLANTEVWKF